MPHNNNHNHIKITKTFLMAQSDLVFGGHVTARFMISHSLAKHAEVLCEKFHSVNMVKGVRSLLTFLFLDRCAPSLLIQIA